LKIATATIIFFISLISQVYLDCYLDQGVTLELAIISL
jgi:hypothetical protein